MTTMIASCLRRLTKNELDSRRTFNLTPSENIMSPLARLPFSLDIYSRYFLDDLRQFGRWFFPSGKDAGDIEQEVLLPVMRDLAHADHVNVRPISGINCMTVAMAALTKPGDVIMSVPVAAGGHASTATVAERFGLHVKALPFQNAYDIDLEQLSEDLRQWRPALLYLDQSTLLFPIDPKPLRALVDNLSPQTLIHYDSSHLNGLILFGDIPNPLDCGAHIFGGSTHKTLPGPHKGFLATNDKELARRIQGASDHFVSHHHMADVASLAITLIELNECGGAEYAQRTIENAQLLAATLADSGIECAGKERGYTACHQVWVIPPLDSAIDPVVERLKRCHIVTNNFNGLPGISQPAFRLSSAEFTRLGATGEETKTLAGILAGALMGTMSECTIQEYVAELHTKLDRPRYCYEWDDLLTLRLAPLIEQLHCAPFQPQQPRVCRSIVEDGRPAGDIHLNRHQ